MASLKERTKSGVRVVNGPRFHSKITPHLNAILRLRYDERKPVENVLAWLAEQKCSIERRSYQQFMLRVLRLMSLELAKKLGVDVDLLRAIRVRLKIPPDPRRARSTLGKPMTRFDSRHRQRRLQTVPKAKRPAPPARPTRRGSAADPDQLALAGIVPPAVAPGMDQVKGDVNDFQSLSRADWKIINTLARGKLRVIDRKVYPNQSGRVFHLTTRVDYSREKLIREFGLTPAEAESCFLTL